MINYPPRGLILKLVTPLHTEGEPDRESLSWLIQRLKKDAGAILAGSLEVGEALKLNPEARIEILEASLIALKISAVSMSFKKKFKALSAVSNEPKRLIFSKRLYSLIFSPLFYSRSQTLPTNSFFDGSRLISSELPPAEQS